MTQVKATQQQLVFCIENSLPPGRVWGTSGYLGHVEWQDIIISRQRATEHRGEIIRQG